MPRFIIGMFWLYAAWCAPAWADVYGFIDEQGVAHLAPKALDERYRLFKRAPCPLHKPGRRWMSATIWPGETPRQCTNWGR